MEAAGGAGWVVDAEAAEVLRRVPALMRCTEQSLAYALAVLERLAGQADDERNCRAMLRMLVLHATPHPALTRQLVEVIGCHEHPSWLVEVAAQLCDPGESGIDMIVELYKELLSRDRAFLVPVIGSLGELPLPASLKGQVLGMMQESLSIVEEADVPTVVRALLASLSSNTRASIVHKLRHHASSLPPSSLPLVVELVGSALRADAAAASVYLQAVRHERRALSSMDIAILVILGSKRGDRGSVYAVVMESVRAGTMHLEALRSTIGMPHSAARPPAASAAGAQLLDMSYTPTWLALVDSLGRNASAGEERVAATIVTVYTALFRAHPMGRFEVVGALLRACIVPPLIPLQPAARAARSPTAGRQAPAASWSGGCGMVADSASRALVALGSTDLLALSDYAHLMEEALYHVAGEKLAYDRLCAVLGAMAAAKDGLLGNLMVFCRKQLFSAVDGMQRAAVTLVTHVVHQPGVPDEDRAALLGLALSATTKQRSLGGAMVELCSMITHNITRFSETQLRDVFEQTLLPALKRDAGGEGHRPRAGPRQLVEVGPASDHVDPPLGLGGSVVNTTSRMLRLVTTQWVRKYHPQATIGMRARPTIDWFERRPQILPALIRTYAVVGHRLGKTPNAGCGVHLCRYYVPAAAVQLARRMSGTRPEMNPMDADHSAVTSNKAEAAEVAWCCVYTAAGARSALAAVTIADVEQQQKLDREESEEEARVVSMANKSLSFSYRWLRAAEAAAEELSGWDGEEESAAVRAALLSLPGVPRGLLSRVLSHVSLRDASGEADEDSGLGSLVEEIGLEEYLLHGVHDQLLQQAEMTQHATLCRWATRGDRVAGGVTYSFAQMRDPTPLCTDDTRDSVTSTEQNSYLATALIKLLDKYTRLANQSLRELREQQYPAGTHQDDDSDDGLLDANDTECLATCNALCTIWRLLAVTLEFGSCSLHGQEEWLLHLARAVLLGNRRPDCSNASGATVIEDGQWARRVLFAYVEAHFLQAVEPHVGLLILDALVVLSRIDESSSSSRIAAVGKLYGRFLQTKYSHIAPQLSVQLPAHPLVASLCAAIRGEGRGEDVAIRWSALLRKMCNSAPKLAAVDTGSRLGASGSSQCKKRLAHHALVSLSVLVSSSAASGTASSTGGATEMLPVVTDILGCIETFMGQHEGRTSGALQSVFVLPAITPSTLPLFVDLMLRVSSLFDFGTSAARGGNSVAPEDESWAESVVSLGIGLRLRQRLGFVLWQLELAGVAGGWNRSATNAITQRFLSHLATALPAVRKRIQREVLPVATANGRDNEATGSENSARPVGDPSADSADLSAASPIDSCAEVVTSASALVAQLRRLCALVKTREQERGVRLSQRSFEQGGRRRDRRFDKYRTPDTDDGSDSDGLEEDPSDEAEDQQGIDLSASPSSLRQSAVSPAGTGPASSVGLASPSQRQFSEPPARKRRRSSPSAGPAQGRIRKHQRRRLVQSLDGDENTASDDDDFDVTAALVGLDHRYRPTDEEEAAADDANGFEPDSDRDGSGIDAADEATALAASMASRPARRAPSATHSSPTGSGGGRGRRGRSVLSRVTYAVAALTEVLMSAPASMHAPLLEDESSSQAAAWNANQPQAPAQAHQAETAVNAGDAAAPINRRPAATAMVVSTSSGKQPSMRPQFFLPLAPRTTVPTATATKQINSGAGSTCASTGNNLADASSSGPPLGRHATRDEAVRAANRADGYDSTDSDDDDDDSLGAMRGYRGRGSAGAIRKKPLRPPASADAFRAVPRVPQLPHDSSRQGSVEPGAMSGDDGNAAQAKVAALEARLSPKPAVATTAWGQSPDPRR